LVHRGLTKFKNNIIELSVKVWKLYSIEPSLYLSCYRWHAIYFCFGLCPHPVASLLSWTS